jgi:hypothetical protein
LLNEHRPASDDIDSLKAALVTYVRSGPRSNTAAAVFALGKFEDQTLIPLFRELLNTHLNLLTNHNAIVGNLICALDQIGERIISNNSFTFSDTNKNMADSRQYLMTLGKVI